MLPSPSGRAPARRVPPRTQACRRGSLAAGGWTTNSSAPLDPGRVLDRGADQLGEAALDPLPREVVRDGEHERARRRPRPPPTSLNQVRNVFSLSAPLSRADTSLQRLSAVSSFGCSTPLSRLLRSRGRGGENSTVSRRGSSGPTQPVERREERLICRDYRATPQDSPQVWKARAGRTRSRALSTTFRSRAAAGSRGLRDRSDYTVWPASAGRSARAFRETDEADLSAKRAPPQAQARLPRAHGDPGGPAHPEAPPREGPQAPVGVGGVQRSNRLSRSRDFDVVYRHGRSVSTRFLTLYWFARERRAGRAAARARGPQGGRLERRAQPHQAAAARDLAGEARRRGARDRATTTCSSCGRGCPRRPRRAATSG